MAETPEWTAVYWRYRIRDQQRFDSLAEAYDYLATGHEAGEFAADHIIGPDGDVAMDHDQFSDYWGRGVVGVRLPGQPPPPPRTWVLPPEPGPEVVALRDKDGDVWQRVQDGLWQMVNHGGVSRSFGHLLGYSPLTDATGDV